MTAFARARAELPLGALAWEVKTVNGKGLDLRLRLPPGLDAAEPACRSLIAAAVTRGSVQATMTLQRTTPATAVRVDTALLQAILGSVLAAMPEGRGLAPPTMDGLLAVRGVVEVVDAPDRPADQAALAESAVACLRDALRAVTAARQEEGAALGRLLAGHLAAIASLVEAADRAPGRQPEAVRARLARAVETLVGASPALDPERLHAEAVLLAARADIREELDRLIIHIRSALELLEGGGPVGRRLDFLAQELGREANTLCAKSNDAALTAIGLDLRTRIEQFREQVQNLE